MKAVSRLAAALSDINPVLVWRSEVWLYAALAFGLAWQERDFALDYRAILSATVVMLLAIKAKVSRGRPYSFDDDDDGGGDDDDAIGGEVHRPDTNDDGPPGGEPLIGFRARRR